MEFALVEQWIRAICKAPTIGLSARSTSMLEDAAIREQRGGGEIIRIELLEAVLLELRILRLGLLEDGYVGIGVFP